MFLFMWLYPPAQQVNGVVDGTARAWMNVHVVMAWRCP
jgi:hypothetical protein